MKLNERLRHAWNAFTAKPIDEKEVWEYGAGSSSPSHRTIRRYNSSSFSASIFNRIAMDVAMTSIEHVKINEENGDRTPVKSGLHDCLNVEANIDQSGVQFIQDIVYSMFDEGVVAVVPVDTTVSPKVTGSYEINTMRVGKVVQWYPKYVRVKLYNDTSGRDEEITLPKASVAIIENPLYAVVNGPNATLTRLLAKLALMDDVDELVASGKLDLIIALPYAVRNDLQKAQAEERMNNIETQLSKNRKGVAYVDSAEKVIQLNRPVNDRLLDDVKLLSQQFYNQLGLTESVFNGTASESEMRGYYTRTIDPIVKVLIAEFNRKFLTKTARAQGQTLSSYRDPFTLVPIEQIAQIADTFKRNAILTSNEIRGVVHFKPHNSPEADVLTNPNIADANQEPKGTGSLASPDKPQKVIKMSEKTN